MAPLNSFFNPRSVAVIGASSKPGRIGHAIVKNIIESKYAGDIFLVNPKYVGQDFYDLQFYQSLNDIEEMIDLVILAVPAKVCIGVLKQAATKKIKNACVLSAGFQEVGLEGQELEKELVQIATEHQINLLGPNCVGFMDTVSPINASFAAAYPHQGEIALISQSGALLTSAMDWSLSTNIGFSKVVSLGNKAVLSEADFIAALATDDNTKVILAYIEDVSMGDHFIETARQASASKPIIILKSGTSEAGALAATSHTGALAGSDLAYGLSFADSGIVRADTMTEMFDLARAFSNQPIPKGNRVAVITNAGGPGIITADAIENSGLSMARFTKQTIETLQAELPAHANVYNPIDVLGDAQADRFYLALDQALADESVDSAIVLICPTAVTEPISIAEAIVKAHKEHPNKAVLVSFMGGAMLEAGVDVVQQAGIPNYTFPEPAVASLKGMYQYRLFKDTLSRDDTPLQYDDVDPQTVKAVFYDVLRDNRRVLLGNEAYAVANAYGIPGASISLATTMEEAVKIADKIGYPVNLKVASPKIVHKTDVGGVLLDLHTPDEVREGYIQILENVQRYLPDIVPYGIEVQKMVAVGTEIIVGATRDVSFGSMIAFGLGGIYVNLLNDASFRFAKGITVRDIDNMISETKAHTLLRGYRGSEPADVHTLIDVIGRVAKLVTDFPEIAELDINPIFVYQDGLSAIDIKITIS